MSEEEEDEAPESVEEIRITQEIIQDADDENEPENMYKLSPEFYENNDLTESTKQLIKREIDDLFKQPQDNSNKETLTKITKNVDGEIITTTTTTKKEIKPRFEEIEKKIIEDDNNNNNDNEVEPNKKIKISEGPNSEIVKETVIKKTDDDFDVIEITKETIKKDENEKQSENVIKEKNKRNDNKNDNKVNIRKNNIVEKKIGVVKSSNEPVIEKNERKKMRVETNYKKYDDDFEEEEKRKSPEKVAASRIMRSKRLQYKLKNKKNEEKNE